MKLLMGSYGHNPDPSGKQYAYWGGDNYRVGENVVAPVTNYKPGRTYNTMFTIQSTYNPESIVGQYEMSKLSGIEQKTRSGRDEKELPDATQNSSKAQWTRDAKNRLRAMNTTTDTTQASQRLLSRGI